MGIATQSTSNQGSVTNRTVMQFTTDAVAAADTTFNFGFVPRYLSLVNVIDASRYEWFEGLTANSCMKTVTAGTFTNDTANGFTVYATQAAADAAGKKLGDIVVKAAMMTASKTFRFVAEN